MELGYILLEECCVDVAIECPLNVWTSVVLEQDGEGSEHHSTRTTIGAGAGVELNDNETSSPRSTFSAAPQHQHRTESSPSSCCRCSASIQCRHTNSTGRGDSSSSSVVVVHEHQQLFVDCTLLDPFHGKAAEVICSRCRKVRSDFSVLLGLVRANAGTVAIQTIQVLVSETSTSILVTLAFHHLLHHRCIIPAAAATTRKSVRVLPNSMQTLLMIVESNWTKLQESMESLQQRATTRMHHRWDEGSSSKRKIPLPMFPSQLTISELCRRLENSDPVRSTYHQPTCRRVKDDRLTGRTSSFLLDLPPDVWSETLEAFLTVADVNALRSTCRILRHVLRATVPGLKLRLYHHQVESLWWMRERERTPLTEHEILQLQRSIATTTTTTMTTTDDNNWNLHRAVTGGTTAVLQSRDGSFTIRLDAITGFEYAYPPGIRKPRNVARGGMLCDDPGLGKTITVLALILQSGASNRPTTVTKCTDNPDQVDEKIHEEAARHLQSKVGSVRHDNIFYTYWEEEVTKEFRFGDYLKLLNGFLRRATGIILPVEELRLALSNNIYGSDFRKFELAIRSSIETSSDEPTQYLNLWENMVDEFKQSQMRSVRRFFSNAASKPKSNVAALLADENKEKLGRSLISSSSTLLVVPSVLLDHWQSQIEQHVNWKYFTNKTPCTVVFLPKTSKESIRETMRMVEEEKSHSLVLFIDRAGTSSLPDAKFLAQFHVVITTTQRFKNEWRKGSFQGEIQHQDSGIAAQYRNRADRISEGTYKACELLKVHWKRMIVDEGHSMGNKGNSTIQFASWIQASRRWVMTGTPTKQSGVEINQVLNLLNFLQHGFFTPCLDGDTHWKSYIARGWADGNLGSFFRLRLLLGCLMKRHTKLDIQELVPPEYETTKVSMSALEVQTYNTVVSGIQANILLTSMEAKTSGLQDSLLHRSQAKNSNLALLNIRRVCTGWSRVVPVLRKDHYQLTIRMAGKFGFSKKKKKKVKKYIHRAESEQQSECGVCAFRVPIHILMSCCGGLVCTECMTSNTTSCLICEKQFDPDELQQFQPGFVNDWKLNIESKKLKKISTCASVSASADSPRQASVPVVPAQPWRTRRGDGHVCQYDPFRNDGRCILCREVHDACNFMNEKSRCDVCYQTAESCPEDESKSFYLIDKLLKLHQSPPPQKSIASKSGDDCRRPLKAIVFSQFRKTLDFIGDRLLRRFGPGCIAEYFGSHRKEELRKFACDPSCFCLLLTKDGSEGLDLSFVTNIFFLDEIYDKSLREQAVARAWRMGAQGSVKVETLVARNSIEETMGDMDDNQADSFAEKAAPERDRRKLLLTSLKLNTDYHCFARTDDNENDRRPVSAIKRKHSAVVYGEDSSVASSRKKRVRFCLCDKEEMQGADSFD